MNEKMDDKTVKTNMRSSTNEGVLNAASSAITDSYTTPYALHLGATNSEIGLISAFMNIAGIVSQYPGAWLTQRFSRKRIWYMSNFMGKVVWLPIVILPLFLESRAAVLSVITLLTVMYFFTTMRRPAWTSLMGDVVPSHERARYFGTRNAVLALAGLVTIIVAGFLLPATGFAFIFLLSVVLGLVSFVFFSRMREPALKKPFFYRHTLSFNPRDSVRFFRINMNFTKFSFCMLFTEFAINIAAPFSAVYILKNLSISYELFAVSLALGTLARIIALRYWGSIADKYGAKSTLLVTALLMAFAPFGYLFSGNFYHIVIVKVYDGFVWAGFDLLVFNFLLGVTPSDDRPRFIANHNIMAGAGVVFGALFGALLVGSPLWLLAGIQVVFLVSFLLRLSSVALLSKVTDVERRPGDVVHVFWNAVAIEPLRGIKNVIFMAETYHDRTALVRRKIVRERAEKEEWYTKM